MPVVSIASKDVHVSIFNTSTYRWVPLKPDFWEHENQSALSVIWLIYIKLYRKKEEKIWAKWESGLTAVWLKWDPPVYITQFHRVYTLELNG